MAPYLQNKNLRLAVLILLLIGAMILLYQCATTSLQAPPPEGVTKPVSYPHASGWSEAASHGGFVMQYGLTQCLACHSRKAAEETKVADCSACHPVYPHTPGWVLKENHGAEVANNGSAICATLCHGTDLNGGLAGVSCILCHSITPHEANWSDPEQHGAAARGAERELCARCHAGGSLGGGRSCFSCHPLYPHPEGWRDKRGHDSFVSKNGQGGCQTAACHGTDLDGGLSGVSCASCHSFYSHPPQWTSLHGGEAQKIGNAACKACHGDDFRTLFNGKNCFTCHPDYPHPGEATWLPFSDGHGSKIQITYGGGVASCQGCHGADLRTAKGGRSCFSCHPSYPHAFISKAAWRDFDGHGAYALANTKTECQMCHAADYRGSSWNNVSCFSCHENYPHLPGWAAAQPGAPSHGEFIRSKGDASCATARCHGAGLVPSPGVTKGPTCDMCHGNGGGGQASHPAGWVDGSKHGPSAAANIGLCKSCHGEGLDLSLAGSKSCADCHPSYLRHASAKIATVAWDTFGGHGAYLQERGWERGECQICHGADSLGGLSRKSCKAAACHASYPHDQANWATSAHGNYIKTTLANNDSPCLVCHGSGGLGGHSQVSCQGCHANAAHTDPNWATGATGRAANAHSTEFITEFKAGNTLVCTECHGTTYSTLIGSTRCTNAGCHPTGVTHRTGWSRGSGHGSAFSSSYRSTTYGSSRCSHCHGQPIIFTATQTKAALAAQSDCYGCHAAYPHTGYAGATGWQDRHDNYINGRPAAFTNAQGVLPGANILPAVAFTCGGTEPGSCHYNPNPPTTQTRCSQYCHN